MNRLKGMKSLFKVVFVFLLLSSCVKDRTCTCEVMSAAGTTTEEYVYRGKKKAAKDACELRSGTENGVTKNCTLN